VQVDAGQVEKLLDEVEAADGGGAAGSGGSGEADLDARVRLYERVASEVLAFCRCNAACGVPFARLWAVRDEYPNNQQAHCHLQAAADVWCLHGAQGTVIVSPAFQAAVRASSSTFARACLQVSRLQFYAARGAELPFIATLQPRMAAAASALQVSLMMHFMVAAVPGRPDDMYAWLAATASSGILVPDSALYPDTLDTLQERLAEGLAAALAARSASAAGHALHAYSSVGDAEGAQVGLHSLQPLPGGCILSHTPRPDVRPTASHHPH
jgi:hypothetical protein